MKGDLHTRAGRQEPVRQRELRSGEPARGPQHQVKPAASTHLQPAGRADHVTAKATSIVGVPKPATDCGGVEGAARVQGEVRNTRDPSALPLSGQGGSYKPKAKSSAVQRESEGIVVPQSVAQAARTNAVTNNTAGAKGPCFGHVRDEGKREGMAAQSGPNDPGAHSGDVQVRQPQCELWAGAERHRSPWRHPIRRARRDARAPGQRQGGSAVAHAPSGGPSVSRVREIRMHGLTGGPAALPLVHPG